MPAAASSAATFPGYFGTPAGRNLPSHSFLTYAVNNTAAGAAMRTDHILMSDEPDAGQPKGGQPRPSMTRRLKVSELLAGEREVILEHEGQDYRLRITANGKLILTK
jgi:hemin uptake protein HemP